MLKDGASVSYPSITIMGYDHKTAKYVELASLLFILTCLRTGFPGTF